MDFKKEDKVRRKKENITSPYWINLCAKNGCKVDDVFTVYDLFDMSDMTLKEFSDDDKVSPCCFELVKGVIDFEEWKKTRIKGY